MKKKKLLKRIKRLEREMKVITHDFKREIETLWKTLSFAQKRIVELEGSEVHVTNDKENNKLQNWRL